MDRRLDNYIRRYVSVTAVIDTLRRKQLALLDPQTWDDRNDRYFMSLYKEKKGIAGLYSLCAAQCMETYHHWRIFTNGADGACIEIKLQPLEDALAQDPTIRFGKVDYLRLDEVRELGTNDVDRLPFCKRQGFTAEDEYRIVAVSGEEQAAAQGVDIDLKWVNKIYLNPWMPKPLADSLKETLQDLPGCAKLPIGRSLLIDSQQWKRAGEKVVGKAPTKPLVSHSMSSSPAPKPAPSRRKTRPPAKG